MYNKSLRFIIRKRPSWNTDDVGEMMHFLLEIGSKNCMCFKASSQWFLCSLLDSLCITLSAHQGFHTARLKLVKDVKEVLFFFQVVWVKSHSWHSCCVHGMVSSMHVLNVKLAFNNNKHYSSLTFLLCSFIPLGNGWHFPAVSIELLKVGLSSPRQYFVILKLAHICINFLQVCLHHFHLARKLKKK